MKGKRFTVGAVLALALAASVALVATSIGSAKSNAKFKMAIVTDIGSLQDRSFNQLANEGRIYSSQGASRSRRVPMRRRRSPTAFRTCSPRAARGPT